MGDFTMENALERITTVVQFTLSPRQARGPEVAIQPNATTGCAVITVTTLSVVMLQRTDTADASVLPGVWVTTATSSRLRLMALPPLPPRWMLNTRDSSQHVRSRLGSTAPSGRI